MTKELEAFNDICCNTNQNYPDFQKQRKIVETALKDYELIKQTKIIVVDKEISNEDIEILKNQRMFVDSVEQCEIKSLFNEENQKKLEELLTTIEEKQKSAESQIVCLIKFKYGIEE